MLVLALKRKMAKIKHIAFLLFLSNVDICFIVKHLLLFIKLSALLCYLCQIFLYPCCKLEAVVV